MRAAARAAFVTSDPIPERVARVLRTPDLKLCRALRLVGDDRTVSELPVLEAAVAAARGATVRECNTFVGAWKELDESLHPVLIDAAKAGPPNLASALHHALWTRTEGPRDLWLEAWALARSNRRLERLASFPLSVVLERFSAIEVESLLDGLEPRSYPSGLAAWLDRENPKGVRMALVDAVSRGFALAPDERARELLELALGFSVLEEVAFRSLAAAPGGSVPELFEAWQRLDEDEALVRLAWFPDGVRLDPFRSALEGLGSEPGIGRSFVVPHLASFGDEAARKLLSTWLERDLVRLARVDVGRDTRPRPAVESRLLATARALARLSPGDELLARALELAAPRSDDLARELAHLVAPESLPPFLDPLWPDRTRAEVGILSAATARGSEVLRELDERLAADLRARTTVALALRPEPVVLEHLERVALESEASGIVRRAAVDALAACGAFEVLGRVTTSADSIDLRRHALGRFARAAPVALDVLDGMAESFPYGSELGAAWLAARARLGGLDSAGVERLFRGPHEAFGPMLRARQRSERVTSAEFAWRAEFEAVQALARRGTLGTEPPVAMDWWAVDGDFLAGVAQRVAAQTPEHAGRFLAAAIVAIEGEGGRERLLGRLRLSLAFYEGQYGSSERARRLFRVLRADLAEGRVPVQVLSDTFGPFDVDLGLDPIRSFREFADR